MKTIKTVEMTNDAGGCRVVNACDADKWRKKGYHIEGEEPKSDVEAEAKTEADAKINTLIETRDALVAKESLTDDEQARLTSVTARLVELGWQE